MMNKDTKCTAITFSFCMLKKSHRISTNIPGEITRTMNASVAFLILRSDTKFPHGHAKKVMKKDEEKEEKREV